MYVSMSNVISNRIFDEKKGWRDMRKAERIKHLEIIKQWLLTTCNFNSQVYQSINRMSIDNLPKNCGIMNRLTTEGYTAGQDYPGELRFIKNYIKRYC